LTGPSPRVCGSKIRPMEAMLRMKKIDIAELELAYAA
jgi:predicted 3-demethylubiquinone-9 3-methyltransferase (glyoxalase superfamily)